MSNNIVSTTQVDLDKITQAVNGLCEAFSWKDSEEGFAFWADVCGKLQTKKLNGEIVERLTAAASDSTESKKSEVRHITANGAEIELDGSFVRICLTDKAKAAKSKYGNDYLCIGADYKITLLNSQGNELYPNGQLTGVLFELTGPKDKIKVVLKYEE